MSDNPSTAYCTSCGKALSTGRGTFTAWIFGGAKCNCGSAAANDAAPKSLPNSLRNSLPNSLPQRGAAPAPLALLADCSEFSVGDRFEIIECIGRGGMGAVYQVRDVNLDKILAVKALHPALATDRFAIKRFEQEAEAALSLTHANLVAVYEHGVSDNGAPYLVMDYVNGESLSDVLKKEVYFEPMRALDIASQICEALAHAHAKGIIHRDIKPSNVILEDR